MHEQTTFTFQAKLASLFERGYFSPVVFVSMDADVLLNSIFDSIPLYHFHPKGYKFAGMEHGGECHCGDSYGKYGAAPETDCNSKCFVDADIWCGGDWRLSVYATGRQAL